MGDVAITTIVHDGKVIEAGTSVSKGSFKDDQYQALVDAGSIGDPSLLTTVAKSTAAVLQSPDAVAPDYTGPVLPANGPTEEDEAKALRIRTDQVARAAGKDVAKVAEDEAATIAKAEREGNEKSRKAAEKAGTTARTAVIPGTTPPEPVATLATNPPPKTSK